MTPEEFIAKWRGSELSERAAAQSHFNDLCSVLGVPGPTPASAAEYAFEKATRKIGNTQGFADVWKRGCFAWEYKRDRRNLVEAYAQLKQYADDLENPPLLIVSDMQEIRVHTNFTNTIAQQHAIPLAELRSVEARELLRNCFLHPDRLLPTETRESVTAKAAASFAGIAVALRRQHDERRVAHFINKLVFCLFAEDIDLLPNRVFASTLEEAAKTPSAFEPTLRDLFRAMANPNGHFGPFAIQWFNGGLFDDDDVLPLGQNQLRDLTDAARLDWKAIDPTIFGTLFESGLDDKKRAEMASLFDMPEPEDAGQALLFKAPAANRGVGIHYTDEATIMKIIEPVVAAPLRREWEQVKAQIRQLDERRARATAAVQREKLLADARGLYADFRARLGRYRVLDPACGSGNFLALSLRVLKDLDLAVLDDAKAMRLPIDNFRVGPEAVLGIEINAYAAELARLTVWITELQWQIRKGFAMTRRPILDKLDGITRADALLTPNGNEREWPPADVIVGNPPFLGGGDHIAVLGSGYTETLRGAYRGRVPARADLVAYWFAKAWERMREDRLKRAGLVATQAIRRGASRRVLDRIAEKATIYDAWADEPWVLKGAAVRVSLICFGLDIDSQPHLNGHVVPKIHSDLSGNAADLTRALRLNENLGVCFQGPVKVGAFDIPGSLAREWLQMPMNPNGRGNADVVRPWVNGRDLTARPSETWIIDFGEMTQTEAALYQAPFEYLRMRVQPVREKNADRQRRERWWRLGRSGGDLREAAIGLARVAATPRVAKHRFFVWIAPQILPDSRVNAVAREDDVTFGILQSRYHEAWSIRLGGWHGVGNDPQYTPRMGFETFPFPEGLTPNILAAEYASDQHASAIAEAARRLNELRNAWLNPPDLVDRVPEVVPGFPDRILPKNPEAAAILKKRTLTNLYNQRPAWLDNAHRDLDAAVAAAYGWPADISEEDALAPSEGDAGGLRDAHPIAISN
jgi:type II restriction/modification system DNA methylase subunit YeeA